MLKISNLTCEYSQSLLGTDELYPRFSWIIHADGRNISQKAMHLEVATNISFNERKMNTGWQSTNHSIHVEYSGTELIPSTRYFFRVRIRDNRGEESEWSNTSWFETGLLTYKNWKADFISPEEEIKPETSKGCILKKDFFLKKKISSARIYATALGLYELFLNGNKIGENTLAPGWTNYNKRLLYQTYDVTSLLIPGSNSLECGLGCGWYKGDLASWLGLRNVYGKRNALSLQILLHYEDGEKEWILTNRNWKSRLSPVIYSEIYHGETYDANIEKITFLKGIQWTGVDLIKQDKSVIYAQDGPLTTPQGILQVQKVIRTPSGALVLDFGQNMTGRIRFKVRGKSGDRVILKHAEVLNSKGEFYTANLRLAKQRIEYILSGREEELYEPHFTFQGFRYVLVEEYPGIPDPADFQAVVLHSIMDRIGSFKCSNKLVNQLHHNIHWGMKGNFLDIPTDCPQRDERLGWTGDAQVFISTASYLARTAPFFRKWLRDLKSEQLNNGGIPHVIPNVMKSIPIDTQEEHLKTTHSATGWADAAVICPWEIYRAFGDCRILGEQYETMKAWIGYIYKEAENGLIWNSGFHFGDWLALDAKKGSYFGATPNDLIATAFYANSVEIMSKTAAILNKSKDQEEYNMLHNKIIEAFQNRFYTPSGRISAPTQTAHILALMFNLVPKKYRKETAKSLVKLIEENDYHITTGFLGTPYICRVLSDIGQSDIAYKLLLQEDYPSWLYSIKKGATTIWEHWDGIKPNGTMWSSNMNSFNHYAYGAIGHWLYETIGGIQSHPTEGGYKKIILKPRPGGGLTNAEVKYQTPYGELYLKWKIVNNIIEITVKIPHNTEAILYLPKIENEEQAKKELHLGSGEYLYTYNYS